MQSTALEDRLLTKEDLAKQFNIPASNATLSRYRRFKGMPAPIRITTNTVRWRASDIRAWIDSLAQQHDGRMRKTPEASSDASGVREKGRRYLDERINKHDETQIAQAVCSVSAPLPQYSQTMTKGYRNA